MEPSKIHFLGPIFFARCPLTGIRSPMAKVLACETKTQSAYVIDGSYLRIYEITYVLRLAERIKRNGKLNQGQFFRIFKTQNLKEFQLEF